MEIAIASFAATERAQHERAVPGSLYRPKPRFSSRRFPNVGRF